MTRPPLIAGNWKMHLLGAEARSLAKAVARAASEHPGVDVAVFPAYPLLHAARTALAGSAVALGGQAVHEAAKGAHTGSVSAAMLVDAGCDVVLCGHSERRAAGITDAQVGARARTALDQDLRVVVCVGEELADREAGRTEDVLARQLDAVLASVGAADVDDFDLAYEPVWAIGTGRTATPEIASDAHRFLRGRLLAAWGDAGAAARILYGGSVKPANSADLLAADEVGGALVGGAALDGGSFAAIVEAGAASVGACDPAPGGG